MYGSSLDIGSEHNFADIFCDFIPQGDATNGYKLSPSQGWTVSKQWY
jgi:hypothetical protein